MALKVVNKSLKSVFDVIKKDSYITKDLDMYLLKQINSEDEESDRAINVNAPSSIGGCLRARYYTRTGVKRDPGSVTPRTQRIWDNGTHVHLRLQEYLLDAGILLMDEVPVHDPELNIQGHTDGIFVISPLEKGVVELKSIKHDKFTDLKDAYPEHKQQALAYLSTLEKRRKWLLQFFTPETLTANMQKMMVEYALLYQHIQSGKKHTREDKIAYQCDLCWQRDSILISTPRPLSKCVVVYESKDTQELKEYVVTMTLESRGILEDIARECVYLNECVKEKTVPERQCKNKSDPCGRWCDFKNTCFVL